jgi:nicotinate (nicotinamide) nucleotide adenylyltransferase
VKSRIGIYSGTFDPIHQGHLAFAEAALEACKLNSVVFLPERRPRGKRHATDISHRVALIERAAQGNASLRVLNLPVDQFTVANTLPTLRSTFKNADLIFLMGSDTVLTFPWEGLDTLFQEASLAIGMRANDSQNAVTEVIATMENQFDTKIECTYIRTLDHDITSSGIRNGTTESGRPSLRPACFDFASTMSTQAGAMILQRSPRIDSGVKVMAIKPKKL